MVGRRTRTDAKASARSFPKLVAMSAICGLVACAANVPEQPERTSPPRPLEADQVQVPPPHVIGRPDLPLQVALRVDGVAALQQSRDVRADLCAGYSESELVYVGFDQISLGGCVDRIVKASRATAARPDGADVQKELRACVALYWSICRDVLVRRQIGRASCLPDVRAR